MNKSIKLGLIILVTATVITGCVTNKPSVPNKPGVEQELQSEVSLPKIHKDIKKELGDDYVSNMELSKEDLIARIELKEDAIEEYIAEIPMMSTHIDTFIAIKAKDGKVDVVEEALKSYRKELVNDSIQYPMNLAKVEASEVIKQGDYVFYIMLGKFDNRQDVNEEEQFKFAEEQKETIKQIILNNFVK